MENVKVPLTQNKLNRSGLHSEEKATGENKKKIKIIAKKLQCSLKCVSLWLCCRRI